MSEQTLYTPRRRDFASEDEFVWTLWRFQHAIWWNAGHPMWPVKLQDREFRIEGDTVVCNGIIVERKP